MKKKWSLFSTIMFLVFIVVIFSLLMTDILISKVISVDKLNSQEEKALTVSRIMAKTDLVQATLNGNIEANAEIQDYTKEIQQENNVQFIVVMDMNSVRFTHPDPSRIGKRFLGGDEQAALKGKEETSISEGTLGKSLRAFTPVYDVETKEQIGVVAVGISLDKVNESIHMGRWNVFYGTLLGLVIGIIGAYTLAKYIKKVMFNLELQAIAKLLQERSSMLHSVREGIIAVDVKGQITVINKSAIQYLKKVGLTGNPIGAPIQDFLPSTRLNEILETGKAQLDEEQQVNGTVIVVNRVPVIVEGKIVGALSTFRDKTELKILADQLTGVKSYAEALRAQSHEFMNRMQVIVGMLHMKSYDRLENYVDDMIDQQSSEIAAVTNNVKDPVVAGLIIGKLSYAREKGASLQINIQSIIPELSADLSFEIITILGNLIDNALDAMNNNKEKTLEVTIKISATTLFLSVSDTGIGIPEEKMNNIFKKGYSTKGDNRGYGLYLIAQSIKKLQGTIKVQSKQKEGTIFNVIIPFKKGEDRQ